MAYYSELWGSCDQPSNQLVWRSLPPPSKVGLTVVDQALRHVNVPQYSGKGCLDLRYKGTIPTGNSFQITDKSGKYATLLEAFPSKCPEEAPLSTGALRVARCWKKIWHWEKLPFHGRYRGISIIVTTMLHAYKTELHNSELLRRMKLPSPWDKTIDSDSPSRPSMAKDGSLWRRAAGWFPYERGYRIVSRWNWILNAVVRNQC